LKILTSLQVPLFEQTAKSGQAPTYYLDEIIIQQTSASATFIIAPLAGTKLFVDSLSLSYVDGLVTTAADATMPNLSYNKILGVGELPNGTLFRTIRDGKTTFSAVVRSIGDSLKFGGVLQNVISDGVDTCITIDVPFPAPTILDSRKNDRIEVIIRDDLSGLISFTVNSKGAEQIIE